MGLLAMRAVIKTIILLCALLTVLRPSVAYTACLNPTGPTGMLFYNIDHEVMQYCKGSTWVGVPGPGFDCPLGDTIVMASAGWACGSSGCGFRDGTCPTSSSSMAGCISGRTLSWGTVTCGTSNGVQTVTINDPKVATIKPGGNTSAAADDSALYFCADLSLGFDARTNTTLTETYYQQRASSLDNTGWRLEASISSPKNTQIVCFDRP